MVKARSWGWSEAQWEQSPVTLMEIKAADATVLVEFLNPLIFYKYC